VEMNNLSSPRHTCVKEALAEISDIEDGGTDEKLGKLNYASKHRLVWARFRIPAPAESADSAPYRA
jgi:hypothetical protein